MREIRGLRAGAASEADDSAAESLALRILGDLANLIYSRPTLEDFEIIPVETNNNKSPIVHTEQHLGLESWCVKHVYNYAYNKLTDEYILKKNPKKINHNNRDFVDTLLIGVLLINPDVATFWNKRKEMVVDNLLNYIDESRFTKIVLSYKNKCNEVFAYRKWLIKRVFSNPHVTLSTAFHVINEELDLIDRCAEKSSNNYHAWSHRIWLMELIKHRDQISFIYNSELITSDKWVSTHVSDYSVLHYRQFCIKNLLRFDTDSYINEKFKDSLQKFLLTNFPNCSQLLEYRHYEPKRILDLILGNILETETLAEKYGKIYDNICLLVHELVINKDICRMYSSHESLWCHRRFAIQQIIVLLFQYFGESRPKVNNHSSELNERHLKLRTAANIISDYKDDCTNIISDKDSFGKEPKILRCDNHSIYNSILYKAVIANEKKFIDERFKAGDVFSKRYETWLRVILHITI